METLGHLPTDSIPKVMSSWCPGSPGEGVLFSAPSWTPALPTGVLAAQAGAAVGASTVTELAPASPPSASCGLLQDYREEIWGWVSLSGTCCCDFLSCCISIRLDTAPLSPLVALALRISSKITPPLPALQFPGARQGGGGGAARPALLGCPRGPQHLAAPRGEGAPKVQSVRPQACAECLSAAGAGRGPRRQALPFPTFPTGCRLGWGRRPHRAAPPFFSALPVELIPLNCNCHLQVFNGEPAAHSWGRGLNQGLTGRRGLGGSWVGEVVGGQGATTG